MNIRVSAAGDAHALYLRGMGTVAMRTVACALEENSALMLSPALSSSSSSSSFTTSHVVQMGKTSGRGNLRTSKRHVPLIQIIHGILLINLIVQRSWVVRVLCSLPAVRDLGILTHRPAYFLIRTLQVAIGADECCTQCQGAQGCQAFAWQAWTSGTFSPFLSTLCSSLATL